VFKNKMKKVEMEKNCYIKHNKSGNRRLPYKKDRTTYQKTEKRITITA